jgi:RNA polymerase sigma-70 factor (ECF subfamily)
VLPDAVAAAAVADAHRREWAFVLAATVRVTRDIDVAEECVQDAYARALTRWGVDGVPANPAAWLTTVARRRAIDVGRRDATMRRALPLLVTDDAVDGPDADPGAGGGSSRPETETDAETDAGGGAAVPDDRLRLIFVCCHPALAQPARVALTLRLLCGLTTAEVARAFLVSEPAMAARITRAKKKIAAARIPYRVPAAGELPERLAAVLDAVNLVFTTGHTAPVGADLVRQDLVRRALDLARLLRALMPTDPDVAGLLALILLTDARRDTRQDASGRLLLLAEQDRSRWDRRAIAEGMALITDAARGGRPSRYALLAAIAAVHARAPEWDATDWARIVALYDELVTIWPSPVVALNRAAAVGFAVGPEAGLAALDELAADPRLAGYSYLAATRADFLRRLGRLAEAETAYTEALMLTQNTVERDFLRGRLANLLDT